MKNATLFIQWYENDKDNEELKLHECGPFHSICPDGRCDWPDHEWTAYRVIDREGKPRRITIPGKYHTILTKV